MAELKTKETDGSVGAFLAAVPDEKMRKDCQVVAAMMERVVKTKPKMWGDSIVGFGTYHYKYPSGREGDWFLAGFSPRKKALTLYVMAGFTRYDTLMDELGKYKTGKSCLYVKRLEDIDLAVLEELIDASADHVSKLYPRAKAAG